ncbi:hypothetical protein F4776DRAFT_660424 [Hypoxylon sp. NC0597]|nr:hypothetical protein F4776DRAFT_660424 [Hypoxylon sp. NC0597]
MAGEEDSTLSDSFKEIHKPVTNDHSAQSIHHQRLQVVSYMNVDNAPTGRESEFFNLEEFAPQSDQGHFTDVAYMVTPSLIYSEYSTTLPSRSGFTYIIFISCACPEGEHVTIERLTRKMVTLRPSITIHPYIPIANTVEPDSQIPVLKKGKSLFLFDACIAASKVSG